LNVGLSAVDGVRLMQGSGQQTPLTDGKRAGRCNRTRPSKRACIEKKWTAAPPLKSTPPAE